MSEIGKIFQISEQQTFAMWNNNKYRNQWSQKKPLAGEKTGLDIALGTRFAWWMQWKRNKQEEGRALKCWNL